MFNAVVKQATSSDRATVGNDYFIILFIYLFVCLFIYLFIYLLCIHTKSTVRTVNTHGNK